MHPVSIPQRWFLFVGVCQVVFTFPLPFDPEDPTGARLVYSIVGGNTTAAFFYLSGRNVIEAANAGLDFENVTRRAFVMVRTLP